MYIHEDIAGAVERRVADMAKSGKDVADAGKKYWRKEHRLLPESECPEVGTIPRGARLSMCCQYGSGRCICKGRGHVIRLCARNLARAVVSRAPKKSKLRTFHKTANVVFNIGDMWLHVGLQYFKPQRPAFIALKLLDRQVWGCRVVKPLYHEAGDPQCETVHDSLDKLDLSGPLSLSMFKFVCFDKQIPDWRPDRLLTRSPMSLHAEVGEEV